MALDPFEDEIRVKQRPTFLTVLCILTFIGSGYGIINSAVTYFKADTISKMVTEAKTEIDKDMAEAKKRDDKATVIFQMMGNMAEMSTPENLRKGAIANLIPSLLCLAGAILMWKLRKTGFYFYTLGTLIGIVAPFYMFGNNILANFSAGMQGFIGILFVIFYAMNLKSMTKAPKTAELY